MSIQPFRKRDVYKRQGETEIRKLGEAKTLYCTNPDCQVKHMKSFALFVSRDALNIEGLSEATLEKFIARGFIRNYADLFHLDQFREEIQAMEGFGEKSYQRLIESAEKARKTTLAKVIYSLGIANVGLANAKVICRAFEEDPEKIICADAEALAAIDGIGSVIAGSFCDYFSSEIHVENFRNLLKEVSLTKENVDQSEQIFAGMNFVVTGSVHHFANRNEVKEVIEKRGGKVTGSVTSKTNYLINNDTQSSSSKNKKAKELGIPVISEEEFLELLGENN